MELKTSALQWSRKLKGANVFLENAVAVIFSFEQTDPQEVGGTSQVNSKWNCHRMNSLLFKPALDL